MKAIYIDMIQSKNLKMKTPWILFFSSIFKSNIVFLRCSAVILLGTKIIINSILYLLSIPLSNLYQIKRKYTCALDFNFIQ